MPYDPNASLVVGATAETGKTISNTVLTFASFTNLTSYKTNPRITAYRVTVSTNDVRYLWDADPSTTVGHILSSTSGANTHDIHAASFYRMRWIRNASTDASMTITPIHSTGEMVYYDGYGLSLLANDSISGAKVTYATTSADGVVELATDAEMATGTSTSLVPPVSAVQSKITAQAYTDAAARWIAYSRQKGIIDKQSAGLMTGATGINSGYLSMTLDWPYFRIPDYTPGGNSIFFDTHTSGNNKIQILLATTGKIVIYYVNNSGVFSSALNITPTTPLVDDHAYHLGLTINMATELVTLYCWDLTDPVNGIRGANGSVTATGISAINFGSGNTNPFTIGNDTDTIVQLTPPRLFNRAFTSDEYTSYHLTTQPPVDQRQAGNWTLLTSGTLTVGKYYRIKTYISGDDFTNVASVVSGTINTDGCIFKAIATTPTTWTNSSSLYQTGDTLAYGDANNILQIRSNATYNHLTGSVSGLSLIPPEKQAWGYEYLTTLTWAGTTTSTNIRGSGDILNSTRMVRELWLKPTVSTTVNVGDEASATRYASSVSLTANIWTKVTLSYYQWDGTNGEIKIAPTSSLTGSIRVKALFNEQE